MDRAVIAFFLLLVLALLLRPVQAACRNWIERSPRRIFIVPTALSGLFLLALSAHGVFSLSLALLVLGYAFAPTALAWVNGRAGRTWLEMAAILLLWLPLEFSAGRGLLPRAVYGTAHTLAYGVAVLLGLFLFLIFRRMDGMKYGLPRKASDAGLPLLGLLVAAPVLIWLGLLVSFIQPFHVPADLEAAAVARRFFEILAGVALPEEILFRSLIQNWLMQKLGFNNRTLLVAALIFGAAHLNNVPFGFPNWRYMILATIAGFVYGKVFQRATSVLSSAALHAAVNTLKQFFF